MTWKDWEPWEDLYKKWIERISETKINLTWPSLKGLWQWFVREIESRGIDVETIDVEALLDPTLTISENKQILLEEMKAPLTEKEYDTMYQEQKGLLEKEAEEKYPEIITPLKERMLELEREADKKKRYQKLVKSLRWELAETVKRLEQERAKPVDVKPVKLRVLRDFKEGIIAYKSGQTVETRDLEWALQKIDAGIVERFKPEVAVPAVPPVPKPLPPLLIAKIVKVKVKVESGAVKGEYIARMFFDSFEAGFIGFRLTEHLDEWLKRREEIVDWRENLRLAGFSVEEIDEELKSFPAPFREGLPIKVVWIYPEDVSFDAAAQKYWNIAHTPYEKAMLEIKTVEALKEIAQIKGLRVPDTKEELIDVILGVPAKPRIIAPTLPLAKPRELTVEEKRRLEDEFQVTLIRELGRVPKNSMAEFRLELDTVKTQPFEKAREIILELTKEIIGREYAKAAIVPPPERIVRLGVPEEERPPTEVPPEFLAYPVELPKKPLSPATFPRSPTSEERAVIWDWFKYEMSRLGQDPYRWRKVLEERLNIPYRTWEGFLKTLDEMVQDIAAGKPLVLIPLLRIPMPWEEEKGTEKWRRDAIVHFVATKLHKTMDELIEKLSEWGVFPAVTPEEVKEAVKDAWQKKDIWFTSVPREYIEELIGESME